jgi:predicted NUDIX family phosphoesterase
VQTTSASPELVLGLPRELVVPNEGWHGVIATDLERWLALVARYGSHRPRAEAESDETWKQVIPYLLLRDGDRIFLMRRTRAGGDARLHERWTIGVGGHVHPDDADPVAGLLREWREELDAEWLPEPVPLGLLNDDTTPVGRVHLGLVYQAEAHGRSVAIRETDKLSGSFVERGDVLAVHERLETWSQLLFDHLHGQGAAPMR